jgi:hypothetical protein
MIESTRQEEGTSRDGQGVSDNQGRQQGPFQSIEGGSCQVQKQVQGAEQEEDLPAESVHPLQEGAAAVEWPAGYTGPCGDVVLGHLGNSVIVAGGALRISTNYMTPVHFLRNMLPYTQALRSEHVQVGGWEGVPLRSASLGLPLTEVVCSCGWLHYDALFPCQCSHFQTQPSLASQHELVSSSGVDGLSCSIPLFVCVLQAFLKHSERTSWSKWSQVMVAAVLLHECALNALWDKAAECLLIAAGEDSSTDGKVPMFTYAEQAVSWTGQGS